LMGVVGVVGQAVVVAAEQDPVRHHLLRDMDRAEGGLARIAA
jgi:hypothetical protein